MAAASTRGQAQKLTKGSRITGADRGTLAAQFAERYARGESVRAIAEDTGRSYGFVHGVLVESGTTLRGRGGATRGAAVEKTATKKTATKKTAAKKTATKRTAAKRTPAKKAAGARTKK